MTTEVMTSPSKFLRNARITGIGPTLAIMLASVVAAGCAAMPGEAGFAEVQNTVARRTGERIQWNRGADEDADVQASVRRMLQQELKAGEAVRIALLNNRELQATFEDLNLAQASLVQAGLLSNPVFDVALGFPLEGGQIDLSFGIVQEFLSILYRPLRKQIAAAQFEAVKLRVAGTVIDLAAQARAGFYQVQAGQQRLEFLRQVMWATRASAEAARALYEAGNIPDLELAREQALYEESRLALAVAEFQAIQDREGLNALMGLWGEDTQWTVTPRLPEIPQAPLKVVNLEKRAVKASLSLGATRHEIRSAAAAVGFTNATALIPVAESGVDAEREEGEWEVGPSFSVPLPIFNQGKVRLAAARSDLRRAQQTYWAQAVNLRSAVRAARATVGSARSRALHIEKVLLPLATRIVNHTRLQYNAMQVGVFQLLEAKREQINVGLQYIDALRDYWLSRGALGQILSGQMTSSTTGVSADDISLFSMPEM